MDNWPKTTGEVKDLLGVPEYKITSQIRLGRVSPPIQLGRRAWSREHVLRVANVLGCDGVELRNICRTVAR